MNVKLELEHYKISEIMEKSAPRDVPWKYSNKAASQYFLIPIVFGLTFGILTVVMLISSTAAVGNTSLQIVLIVVLVILLSMLVSGLYVKNKIELILPSGTLTRGRVVKVRSIVGSFEGKIFSKVVVKFRNQNGIEQEGKAIVNRAYLSLFLDSASKNGGIEIIYSPDVKHWVILPTNLAATIAMG